MRSKKQKLLNNFMLGGNEANPLFSDCMDKLVGGINKFMWCLHRPLRASIIHTMIDDMEVLVMKHIILFWTIMLLIPYLAFADTHNAAYYGDGTCSQVSVASAIAAASNGDTVTVPAGNCTWSNLTITKQIILQGSGIGNTVITGVGTADYNAAVIFSYAGDNTHIFRVTGFTFTGTRAIILKNNSYFSPQLTNLRIDHNRFTNLSTVAGAIWNYGCKGVIDSNTFDNTGYPMRIGWGNSGGQADWANQPDMVFGAANDNIYVEDNVFRDLTTTLTDGDGGGRYAVRYNDFYSASNTYLTDLHRGRSGVGAWSCMGAEIYGNYWYSGGSDGRLVSNQGAGRSAIHHNFTIGTPTILAYWGSALTCPPELYADRQAFDSTYVWMNRKGSVTGNINPMIGSGSGCGVTIAEDITYWNYNAGFDGTVGIGCGTIGNRPSTCTTGVTYWATNQSCSDLTGMVGANPSTPISGTLYKCTSTNKWEPYYTPYTYPHPLRNATTSNPQSPTPTIAVSPTTKDFGSLPINTSSPVQTFTVTTTGGNLNVDAISMTGTDATQFAIQNDSCTGKIIAPETGSCTFDVKFSPSSVGAKAANVSIVDNDSNTSKLIAVNGTGTSQVPAVSFSPTSLSFSGVLSGTLSSPKTITLSNTGSEFVTISSLSLSGTYANQFSIPAATDYCTGETVAASGNCSFQVIFSPTSGGEKTANVNLTALYYGSSATLPLYGSAVIYQTPVPRIKISKIK